MMCNFSQHLQERGDDYMTVRTKMINAKSVWAKSTKKISCKFVVVSRDDYTKACKLCYDYYPTMENNYGIISANVHLPVWSF